MYICTYIYVYLYIYIIYIYMYIYIYINEYNFRIGLAQFLRCSLYSLYDTLRILFTC